MIYLTEDTRKAIRKTIRDELMRRRDEIRLFLNFASKREIHEARVMQYIKQFMLLVNMEDLAYSDYIVVQAFGLMCVVTMNTETLDIVVRIGISIHSEPITFPLRRKNA